mgnify:CR=1 FL=1
MAALGKRRLHNRLAELHEGADDIDHDGATLEGGPQCIDLMFDRENFVVARLQSRDRRQLGFEPIAAAAGRNEGDTCPTEEFRDELARVTARAIDDDFGFI